jgi:hypothetical protein
MGGEHSTATHELPSPFIKGTEANGLGARERSDLVLTQERGRQGIRSVTCTYAGAPGICGSDRSRVLRRGPGSSPEAGPAGKGLSDGKAYHRY